LSWTGGSLAGSSINPGGAGTPASPNIILSQTQGIQLLSKISALETRGLSKVVSVPTVVALNNLEAVFSTRQSFYVSVQGNNDSSLTSVTAQTFLRVTPMFTKETENDDSKRIKLLLNIQDSQVDTANQITSGGSTLPQVIENQISTQAIINNADTLVIGGQVVRKVIDQDAGLPFLSRIPVLGLLFSQRARQYQEFLRIYIISPKFLGEDSIQASAASILQPNGSSITSSKLLRDGLPETIQGTSIPSNPNLDIAPSSKEQQNMNSILLPVPSK
jgi:type III secretion protein C